MADSTCGNDAMSSSCRRLSGMLGISSRRRSRALSAMASITLERSTPSAERRPKPGSQPRASVWRGRGGASSVAVESASRERFIIYAVASPSRRARDRHTDRQSYLL